MPKEFEQCIKNGGNVITKTLKSDKYISLCRIDGKWYPGEVKKKVQFTNKRGK